jgi:hypothetical protein
MGTNLNGERCGRPPHRGGTVCILHGGGSPLAKHAAQRMLMSMVEPAAAILMLAITRCEFEWVIPESPDGVLLPSQKYRKCMVHEEDGCPEWTVRLGAAKTLLSRAGYGEQAKMVVSHERDNLDKLDNQQLADELERLSQDLRLSEKHVPETQEAEFTEEQSSESASP